MFLKLCHLMTLTHTVIHTQGTDVDADWGKPPFRLDMHAEVMSANEGVQSTV